MKKYIYLFVMIFAISFQACDKDTEPGGTAVQDMAGDWWVTCTYLDNGVLTNAAAADHIRLTTYNTAANKSTEMWVNDGGNFWNFKSIVDVNYAAKTFSTADYVSTNSTSAPTEKVIITSGKVLKGAAKTPSGVAADSLVFFAQFNDDSAPIVYKVSGFRRTGFPKDDF